MDAPTRLLIAAARDALTGTWTSDLIQLSDAEWRELPSVAGRHGMTAWLHDVVCRRAEVPAAVKQDVSDAAREQAADALRATRELVQIVGALKRAAVPCVVFKGPALSWWLYGTASRRRFLDLDVAVPHERAGLALATLERLGYRLPSVASRSASQVIYAGRSAWPLARAGAFPIDLHWRFADVALAVPVSVARALEESTTIAVAGAHIPVPSATHTAALMFAHAAKHGWCALELLATLGHVMRRTDVNWCELRRLFSVSGSLTGLVAGARLVEELFGIDIPAELRDHRSASAIRQLTMAARGILNLPYGTHPDRWQERRLHRATLDGRLGRLRYETLRLAMPTPLDAAWYRLPDRLVGLYAPLRLVRLTVHTLRAGVSRVLSR